MTGVALTSAAFGSAISWFPYVLAIAVILFAFSTMISWSYYGLKSWTYLFGEGKTTELVFKVIFCVFVVIGAAASLGPVIDFSDAAIFAMALARALFGSSGPATNPAASASVAYRTTPAPSTPPPQPTHLCAFVRRRA